MGIKFRVGVERLGLQGYSEEEAANLHHLQRVCCVRRGVAIHDAAPVDSRRPDQDPCRVARALGDDHAGAVGRVVPTKRPNLAPLVPQRGGSLTLGGANRFAFVEEDLAGESAG